MPRLLSDEAVQRYHRDGYYFPVRVMSAVQAAHYRRCLERYEHQLGGPTASNYRHKVHLLFTWAAPLIRHAAILDAFEDVLGPNLLCWTTNFFINPYSFELSLFVRRRHLRLSDGSPIWIDR